MSDYNATIIDEFRANHGRVGGRFEGAPLILLHKRPGRQWSSRRPTTAHLHLLQHDAR